MNAPELGALLALTDPVRQLGEWLRGTDLTTLELHGPDTHLVLVRQGTGVVAAAAPTTATSRAPTTTPTAAADTTTVRAGSVGVLRLTPPTRDKPLVRQGQAVTAGQPLAQLQIGLILLPVCAPQAGVVARVVAADGATVGYGDTLFELAPNLQKS